MVHATNDAIETRRLRVGMVGGGRDAFIGAVHRLAMRLDDRIELVAGALSSDPERARLSAADIGIAADRAYSSYQEMAAAEAARADGIEAVVIVTPNHMHAPVAAAFLDAGIDIICDKPLSATLQQAEDLARRAAKSGLVFAVTLNNTGYAMVREARAIVASGALGKIRIVRAEYIQDWLTLPIDADGQKQAEWRTDPARAGRSACLADIGVHAYSLAQFVTGQMPDAIAADLTTFVPGRRLDDNAHVLMRYASGARGVLIASQVSPGNYNRLSLKVYGEKAGLEWFAHEPEVLHFAAFGEPARTLTRGGPGVGQAAGSVSRMPAEHPEGYVEGFANLYRDAAALIAARRAGRTPDPALVAAVPNIHDGLVGMRFIEAAVDSHDNGGAWTTIAA
ncbi:Gfo/Idh/MocA family oxidoreductase [Mesorhizobium sp. PAMC28654]|uniref:Gfo/Idh/MocA family protein n=1 Tax=Mesorhizobium sp. PAMC28654 TaxID=2880934 RepID=UPI001D0AF233|nr:Gfo/Idh/MocA family oxidoreductase [Mesorhizobium sp. PAMC28654]UDL91817.1 Gfo/Idh/MocA family oxidoreductase [Mesorhizobium sp. PAMC28654]